MFRNKDIDIKNRRELGKVSHVFYLDVFMPDLLMHMNYEHKANEFSSLCNDKDYSYKSLVSEQTANRFQFFLSIMGEPDSSYERKIMRVVSSQIGRASCRERV